MVQACVRVSELNPAERVFEEVTEVGGGHECHRDLHRGEGGGGSNAYLMQTRES